MNATTITTHTQYQVGAVDPRVFGGFLEHMGRAVYEGVYDPSCPHADEEGFRRDVMEALRRLRMTAMRYPGGNFASGYHWMDGVGPREKRPTVRELAWQSIETNQFGTDEYIRLCRKMDWTPMLTVNLGTGTPEEASNWVEYCNCPAGTKYADLRSANGAARTVWRQALVPGQRDGRALATRPRARRPVRHPGAAGGQDDEGRGPDDRTGGLRLVLGDDADVHGLGPARAGVPGRRGRLHQPSPLRRQPQRRHARLPGRDQRHRPADRGDGRRLPFRPGQTPQQETTLSVLRRVERLVQGAWRWTARESTPRT